MTTTTKTPITPATDMTADEMFESLTGFDEIAIAHHFGSEITALAETKPLAFLRALVFVHLTRQGHKPHPEIKQDVQGMSIAQVNGYFTEADEVDPEDPVTPAGKDAAPLT